MASKKISSLLKSVSDRLQPVLGFDRFYGAVYDPVRSLVEFPWVVQDGKLVQWVTRPYQPTAWLLDSIIHARSPRLVEQGFEQEFEKDGLKYWPEGDLPQSWLAAPMIAEDRVIGVLVIENRHRPKAFGENGLRVLSSVARQTALAIENARLVERLNTLYKMGPELNSRIRLGELSIIQLIYQQASALMDTSNLYVALYDRVTDTVSFPLMYADGQPRKCLPAAAAWAVQSGSSRTSNPSLLGRGLNRKRGMTNRGARNTSSSHSHLGSACR